MIYQNAFDVSMWFFYIEWPGPAIYPRSRRFWEARKHGGGKAEHPEFRQIYGERNVLYGEFDAY